jgi:hypothetical protein
MADSRTIVWQRLDTDGTELVVLEETRGLRANGTILVAEKMPYRCTYAVRTDEAGHTTSFTVSTNGSGWRRSLNGELGRDGWRIRASEEGHLDAHQPGIESPELLRRALDVDLGGSPFFNTLPIRRLHMVEAEPTSGWALLAVWVDAPSLVVAPAEQTYGTLGPGRIAFTQGSFHTEVEVDETGIVQQYPGLARRVI